MLGVYDEAGAPPMLLACGAFGERGSFTLTSICVPPHMRGRGVGTAVLREVARVCVAGGVRRIDLDDMSDMWGQPLCIYIRCGFRYRRGATMPEMYGAPKRVLRMAGALCNGRGDFVSGTGRTESRLVCRIVREQKDALSSPASQPPSPLHLRPPTRKMCT